MPKVTLNEFERFHRTDRKWTYIRPTAREIAITFAVTFLCAPFLSATFLMIPLIGQLLALIATLLTLTYFYVRASILVVIAAVLGFLLFWAPTLMAMQSIKDRLDVTLFFLMATGIPVSIAYIMLVAGKIWFEIESSGGQD